MGRGSLKYVGLAEARKLAVQNKHLVINGKDPIEERENAQVKIQLEKSRNLTFKEIAKTCIASKSHEWKTQSIHSSGVIPWRLCISYFGKPANKRDKQ